MKLLVLSLALGAGLCLPARAAVMDDYHAVQEQLDSSILDVYDGINLPQDAATLKHLWAALRAELTDDTARTLVPGDYSSSQPLQMAAEIGSSRARLEQIAVLEELAHQRRGEAAQAQVWRDVVTLPQFANADDGGLMLQLGPDRLRQEGVTQALAREYVGWQVARSRQLLDALQRSMAQGEATEDYIRAKLAEVRDLAQFPAPILAAAGLPAGTKLPEFPEIAAPFNAPAAAIALAAWRDKVEVTLPNLLSPGDVNRLQRLLARFVDVVPKEYHNGVEGTAVVIELEYKEAQQFTDQAQGLVNELAPVWRRDQPAAAAKYHDALVTDLARMSKDVDNIRPLETVQKDSSAAGSILSNQFGISAHAAGQGGQIIEETAMDVTDSLNNSLAAARAGHWKEAEAARLDAYTAFDSEIEIRVMPRDPDLATKTERSFLDGQEQPGIKALIDRGAPMDELSAGYARALKNLNDCVALLKVSVSPMTIGFTAFTILAREGLEAIVILAALLAGLRGAEHIATRRGIVQGALLGVILSGLTFWLSQTIVRSLMRYGERLEAVVSVLAVIILLMVTNWVFHKMYWVGWNAKLRDLSKSAQAVKETRWEVLALLGVGFLTVYREGFETTIFMQSLVLEGKSGPVLIGVGAGFLFIGTIGMLIMVFGAKLPYRKLLVVTGILVVSIMTTFLGSAVRLFQTVSWLPVHPLPGLHLPNWVGVWLGLYPSWEGLLIPPLALVYVGGMWLYQKIVSRRFAQKQIATQPPARAVPPRPQRSTVSV